VRHKYREWDINRRYKQIKKFYDEVCMYDIEYKTACVVVKLRV